MITPITAAQGCATSRRRAPQPCADCCGSRVRPLFATARLDAATGGRAGPLARLAGSSGFIRPTPVQDRQRLCGSRVRLVFATLGKSCIFRRAPIWLRGRWQGSRRHGFDRTTGARRPAYAGHNACSRGMCTGLAAARRGCTIADDRNFLNRPDAGRLALRARMRHPGAFLRQATQNLRHPDPIKRAPATVPARPFRDRSGAGTRQGFFNHRSCRLPDGGKGAAPHPESRSEAAWRPQRGVLMGADRAQRVTYKRPPERNCSTQASSG
jgi:hypothetical protein